MLAKKREPLNKEREFDLNRTAVLLLTILILVIMLSSFISAAYARTSTAYTQTRIQAHAGNVDFPFFDRSMCEAGQDFLLQIDPLGCTPAVVRSDLLEEQNVPVFCPVVGTKLNPLIDVNAIDRITFSFNGPAPREVAGISYVPARAALVSPRLQLNQPIMGDLGYVVIVLKRQPNESAMPDFVTGNLTATLRYDIKNAFGVGQAAYYLPVLDEATWQENIVRYGFWHGRGYLRAEDVDDDSATISIYSDREAYNTKKSGDKRRIATHTLDVGKTSPPIPMPGFNYCLGSMQLELKGVENPGTTVKLRVNEDIFELKDGEKFLDESCSIRRGKLEKYGLVQKVEISCRQDESSKPFALIISPKIKLNIKELSTSDIDHEIGQRLYENGDGTSTYLVFATTKGGTNAEKDLGIVVAIIPGKAESLTDEELASMGGLLKRYTKTQIDDENEFKKEISK